MCVVVVVAVFGLCLRWHCPKLHSFPGTQSGRLDPWECMSVALPWALTKTQNGEVHPRQLDWSWQEIQKNQKKITVRTLLTFLLWWDFCLAIGWPCLWKKRLCVVGHLKTCFYEGDNLSKVDGGEKKVGYGHNGAHFIRNKVEKILDIYHGPWSHWPSPSLSSDTFFVRFHPKSTQPPYARCAHRSLLVCALPPCQIFCLALL